MKFTSNTKIIIYNSYSSWHIKTLYLVNKIINFSAPSIYNNNNNNNNNNKIMLFSFIPIWLKVGIMWMIKR